MRFTQPVSTAPKDSKKHNKPKISETMAVIKVINTKFDKWILIATPTNMAAIAMGS